MTPEMQLQLCRLGGLWEVEITHILATTAHGGPLHKILILHTALIPNKTTIIRPQKPVAYQFPAAPYFSEPRNGNKRRANTPKNVPPISRTVKYQTATSAAIQASTKPDTIADRPSGRPPEGHIKSPRYGGGIIQNMETQKPGAGAAPNL